MNQRWRPVSGSRCDITCISAGMHESNRIPTAIVAIVCFRGQATWLCWGKLGSVSNCTWNQRWWPVTESGYDITYISISQFVNMIARKFQRLYHVFGIRQHDWTKEAVSDVRMKFEIKRRWPTMGSRYEMMQYLSIYTRKQHNFKDYTHIVGVVDWGQYCATSEWGIIHASFISTSSDAMAVVCSWL